MKIRNYCTIALVVAGFSVQVNAASDSSNIDFLGNITTATCTVKINNVEGSNTITLADISAPTMKAAIATPALPATFKITVTGCATPPANGKVQAQFTTTGQFNSTSKALLNTNASGDRDAGFQVEDSSNNQIIDFKAAAPQSEATYDNTNGAEFNYRVGYLYSGSAMPTVGQVKANTTFTTTYN